MPETTSHGVQYHVLPDDPLATLNILREAAGLGPWREDREEVGGDGQGERGEER